jgi:hypothetical protein
MSAWKARAGRGRGPMLVVERKRKKATFENAQRSFLLVFLFPFPRYIKENVFIRIDTIEQGSTVDKGHEKSRTGEDASKNKP